MKMIISGRFDVLKRPVSFSRIGPLPFVADMVAMTAENDRHLPNRGRVSVQVDQGEVPGRALPDSQCKAAGSCLKREGVGRCILYGSQ